MIQFAIAKLFETNAASARANQRRHLIESKSPKATEMHRPQRRTTIKPSDATHRQGRRREIESTGMIKTSIFPIYLSPKIHFLQYLYIHSSWQPPQATRPLGIAIVYCGCVQGKMACGIRCEGAQVRPRRQATVASAGGEVTVDLHPQAPQVRS